MMPPETPKQIEERLQRYAKERRTQGGDFALHPATRRLLQDEVRRQHGAAAKGRTGWAGWLSWWRNGLVIGGGVAAGVLFATWMFRDSRPAGQTMQLAKNEAPLNPARARERERRVAEVRDEAKQVVAEVPLSKAKQDSSDVLTRRSAGPEVTTLTDSLTPVPKAAGDPAGANYSLNLSPAPAQSLYANGNAPVSPQTQAGASPLERPTAQLNFQKSGASADQRGMTTQFGLENKSQAGQKAGPPGFGETATAAPPSPGGIGSGSGRNAQTGTGPGLAEADQKQNAPQSLRSVDSPEAGPAGQSRRMNNNGVLLTDLAAKDAEAVAPTAPPAPAPQLLPALTRSSLRGGLENQAKLSAAPAPATQANATTDRYQRVEMESLTGRDADQLEARAPKPAGSVARAVVLDDFTVEQRGDSLRLIDADGSVYEGTIATTNVVTDLAVTDRSSLKKEMVRAAAGEAAAEVGRQYFFRATGSNVTLRQRVLVNGQVRATDELMPATGRAENPSTATRFKAAVGAPGSTNRMSTMEGTVQVGTTNAQKFRAVRTPRP